MPPEKEPTPVPFGKYELMSRLAAGGMAEIFLARSRAIAGFEKYLVIKRILRDRTSDPEFVRMFLDEARIAATLDHPNVVQIYDVGNVDHEYFIAMEYLRGQNLVDLVRTGTKAGIPKPPLEHVITILSHVCAGLHYAHEKRDSSGRPLAIVHRDVTPQNVVVTFDGSVKIVDFGIAKAATREVETLAGTLKGKIGYMSPEQCRGLDVDRRSDVFAVGILLYELTCGRRLYHERSEFDTLKKIIEGPVPSPMEVDPTYPEALAQIVTRCLQKQPEQRYESARALHADLEAYARERQLVTGTVALARYVEQLFPVEVAARDQPNAVVATPMAPTPSSGTASTFLGESQRMSRVAGTRGLGRRSLFSVVAVALAVGGALGFGLRSRRTDVPVTAVAPIPIPAAAPAPRVAPPAPKEVAPPAEAPVARPKAPGDAHVTIAAAPSSEVLVDGAPFGMTPLVDVSLPSGRHAITLVNPSTGEKHVERVRLSPGQLYSRAFRWQDGKVVSQPRIPAHMLAASPGTPLVATEVAQPARAPAPSPPVERPVVPPGETKVASFVLDAQRVSAPSPHLPDYVLQANPGRRLRGTYEICVDPDGKVYRVKVLGPISGADQTIMETLRGWTYKPQRQKVCATKELSFQVP